MNFRNKMLTILILSMMSCQKDEGYKPFYSPFMFITNDVYLQVQCPDGTMLDAEKLANEVSFTGKASKERLSQDVQTDENGVSHIHLSAELPQDGDFVFIDLYTARTETVAIMKYLDYTVPLHVYYEYYGFHDPENPQNYLIGDEEYVAVSASACGQMFYREKVGDTERLDVTITLSEL